MPRRNDILKVMLAVAAIVLSISSADAQVDCFYSRLHLGKLHGIVTDQTGVVIAGAVVRVKRDDQTIAQVETDQRGQFAIAGISGAYNLGVEANGFAPAWSPVEVGTDVQSLLHSNTLRVMLLVGGVEDCALFTTRKREFEKRVHPTTQHSKGSEEKNATQK